MSVLKISAVAMVLALSSFAANAAFDCNAKCTPEAGKAGKADLKACFKNCKGKEIGDVAAAAAEHNKCKDKANHNKSGCQMALRLAGKAFLDLYNDQTPDGEQFRALVKKADDAQ